MRVSRLATAAADGVYMPPDSSGVYACASKKNDSVVVCGGPGKYAKAASRARLPGTRRAVSES